MTTATAVKTIVSEALEDAAVAAQRRSLEFLAAQRRRIIARREAVLADLEELDGKIAEAVGLGGVVELDDRYGTRMAYQEEPTSSFDIKAFRAAHPRLAKRYTRNGSSPRLRVTESKTRARKARRSR